jgi:hypothetical protein
MTHDYWEEQLHAYVDRELGPADQLAMEQHLHACENCQIEVEYFSSLTKRLNAHANAVEIPPSVEQRVARLVEKRQASGSRRAWTMSALGLAAVLVLGLLTPHLLRDDLQFEEAVVVGKVLCHDCHIAEAAGLEMGALCFDGHQIGVITDSGKIYRFAHDERGVSYNKQLGDLYGTEVKVFAEVARPFAMLRVKDMESTSPQQRASLR